MKNSKKLSIGLITLAMLISTTQPVFAGEQVDTNPVFPSSSQSVEIKPATAYTFDASLAVETSVDFNWTTSGNVKLTEGKKYDVSAIDTNNHVVTYLIGNKRVASVDEKGVVTALEPGSTTIYAMNGTVILKKTITVYDVQGNAQKELPRWIAYSTNDPIILADNIAKGYVVYSNGQYWADTTKMPTEEEVVYMHDISPEPLIDRYALANYLRN